MEDSNLEIEIKLLKKDFEYLKLDAKNKDVYLKDAIDKINDAIDKINNKLDDDERIHRIIAKKFDEDMLIFKNKYYNLFYIILVTVIAFSFTIYKTFIK